MTDHSTTLLAVFFGALLLTTGIGAATTTATATETNQCTVSPVLVLLGGADDCQRGATDFDVSSASDARTAIYESASTENATRDVLLRSHAEYLNDTASIARVTALNAYIEARNNGSTAAEAHDAANASLAEYYASKQRQLLDSWNRTARVWNASKATANATTNVSADYPYLRVDRSTNDSPYEGEVRYDGVDARNVTLLDGTQTRVRSLNLTLLPSYSPTTRYVNPTTGEAKVTNAGSYTNATAALTGTPSDVNETDPRLGDFERVAGAWDRIATRETAAREDLTAILNASTYESGAINTTDLVGPRLDAGAYSPNATQEWGLRAMTALGAHPPTNLSTIDQMNVTVGGATHAGVLLSEDAPTDGYTVGTTYNASTQSGLQVVALDSGGVLVLSGEFSVDSATGDVSYADGDSIGYQSLSQPATTLSEFETLLMDFDRVVAEVNAREQSDSTGGAGILPDWGRAGLLPGAAILATAGAFLLLGRD